MSKGLAAKANAYQFTTSLPLLLKLSVSFIFAGRAYQYLFWDAPFRSLLWDEALMKPLVGKFTGMSWNSYVTHPELDNYIQTLTTINGWLFLVCAIIPWFISSANKRWPKLILLGGTFFLLLLAVLEMKSKFYHYAQFFEHSIQIASPLFLLLFLKSPKNADIPLLLRICIALTFTAHGLYALGYYPVPGHFSDMTISITGFQESQAKVFLLIAGILDIIISIAIFIPALVRPALIYAIIWGSLTALVRLLTNVTIESLGSDIHQYFYQFVFRIPHALIPLALYLIERNKATSIKNLHQSSQL